jgi:O-Antigen ligase
MTPLVPALLLALFAAWSGSFEGGASFSGAASGQLALLAAVAWARPGLRDPLALGRAGRLLLLALLAAVAGSWWASPVRRAGEVGLVLLPAYLLLPALVAAAWRGEEGRRRGLRAVAVAVAAVALWALADRLAGGSPRAAMPLGHHNLLAAWLVMLLPLAALAVRERGAWGRVALGAALVAVAAVVASGSLVGMAALGVEAAVLATRSRRLRVWAVAGLAALAVFQLPRLIVLAGGGDPSFAARRTYLAAGWRGLGERPVLGWGPGAVPWTVAAFLRPLPGVNPPSEVVGQVHFLPLELAYELGWPGALLAAAVAALFGLRRLVRRRAGGGDGALTAAGLVGLLGGAVSGLGTAWLAVPALPVALAVAAGAALAGEGVAAAGEAGRRRWGGALYAALALLALARSDFALWHYEAARGTADPGELMRHLSRAVAADPAFPLYRARLASYQPGTGAAAALAAARGAPGVAALWLAAGVAGVEEGAPWAPRALARAQRLDPLGGYAPFYRMVASPTDPAAPACGARALLGEPRLAAATFWQGRPELRERVRARLAAWPGVDPGWLAAMIAAAAPSRGAGGAPLASLSAATETEEGAASLSLHAFRRRSWGAEWFSVEVDARRLAALDLPPAAALASSRPEAFPPDACGPGGEISAAGAEIPVEKGWTPPSDRRPPRPFERFEQVSVPSRTMP